MKIFLVINNPYIENAIIEKYSSENQIIILNSIIGFETNIDDDSILIIRLKSENDISDIKKIRDKSSKIKIVAIIKELTDSFKQKLFAMEVFNIIEGHSITIEDIVECIENPRVVIYKHKNNKISKSKIVFVTGTRNSGKTIFVKLISEKIAKDKKKKVIVLDLDMIYPALDTYLVGNINNSLVDLINDIMAEKIKKIDNYLTQHPKFKNLSYVLNSKSIGIPTEEILLKLIIYLKSNCDYLIIDTSTIMINKIYTLANKLNGQVIYMLDESEKAIREYELDTEYIEKEQLNKTKYIVNKNTNNKRILKLIQEKIPTKISLKIPRILFLSYQLKNNLSYLNFNGILKQIGVIKFEKLKLKIIERMLNLEEE